MWSKNYSEDEILYCPFCEYGTYFGRFIDEDDDEEILVCPNCYMDFITDGEEEEDEDFEENEHDEYH